MEKPKRGRPRKLGAKKIENSENVSNKTFEPIIISFDIKNFKEELKARNEIIEIFYEAIKDIHESYGINMNDSEIKKYIIRGENLKEFTNNLFLLKNYSKRFLELAQYDVYKILDDCQQSIKSKYSKIIKDFKSDYFDVYDVKKGVININKEFIENIRIKYSYSIETQRAKEIYDLHQKAVEIVCKIREMAKEKGFSIEIGTLFEYDSEYNIKARELKYNLL